MNLMIRPAKIEDAYQIISKEREIAKTPGFFCSEPDELSEQNIIRTITDFQEKGNGVYLVAECDKKIVGHAFLTSSILKSLSHVGELNIAVYIGWQGKGIGKLLLQNIIDWAIKSKRIKKIQLNVRSVNTVAISLYKKMGFKEEGRLKNRVKVEDRYIDDLIMGLDLFSSK